MLVVGSDKYNDTCKCQQQGYSMPLGRRRTSYPPGSSAAQLRVRCSSELLLVELQPYLESPERLVGTSLLQRSSALVLPERLVGTPLLQGSFPLALPEHSLGTDTLPQAPPLQSLDNAVVLSFKQTAYRPHFLPWLKGQQRWRCSLMDLGGQGW